MVLKSAIRIKFYLLNHLTLAVTGRGDNFGFIQPGFDLSASEICASNPLQQTSQDKLKKQISQNVPELNHNYIHGKIPQVISDKMKFGCTF